LEIVPNMSFKIKKIAFFQFIQRFSILLLLQIINIIIFEKKLMIFYLSSAAKKLDSSQT